jgi:hypothetical protein
MKLSAEELEKIKQSHKAKDLQEIIKEEADKKDDEDSNSNNSEDGDGGDQNFISGISSIVENHTISETDSKRENVYQKLKDELGNVILKLKNAVRPVSTEIRSLDNEVGGVEVNYEAVAKEINQDVDIWDDRTKKIAKGAKEADLQDMEENESFIHGIKAGLFGKRRGKKRKHLGQVDLGKAAEDIGDAQPASFVERVSKLKEDRSHNQGETQGGGMSF